MNKQELVDKAVHECKGILPSAARSKYREIHGYLCIKDDSGSFYPSSICSDYEFQQRARELGYVNGYRWGVEYPTNGKKPDLPSDIAVSVFDEKDESWWCEDIAGHFSWKEGCTAKFKITDTRYKPADTSYLDKPETISVDSTEWYDYETQKALRLPPVGVEVEWSGNGGYHWHKTELIFSDETVFLTRGYQLYKTADDSIEFRPLDWNRKAEAERKRVVDAALQVCGTLNELALLDLYDAGFLRMPEDK